MSNQKKRNRIHRIKADKSGKWVTRSVDIEQVMVDYFKNIFHTNNCLDWQQVIDLVERKITDEMNE